jgi:tRNA pseudouridine55 synthase
MSDGALLLDKPVGISSNRALQEAKKLLREKKAGHAGTLDPLASGLLVLLFGEATKLAGPLLDDDKEYVATVRLGEKTSTGDAEGEVVQQGPLPDMARLRQVLDRFVGEVEQVPPMYSALKRGGVPLYALARKGESVERASRRVRIAEIESLGFSAPDLRIRVRCSKGTYIRTLAEDIGGALGSCAHLAALRRTASGTFRVEDAVGLGSLADMPAAQRVQRLLGMDRLLRGLPRAELDREQEARFRNGQTLKGFSGTEFPGTGLRAVYGAGGRVLGLGEADSGTLRPLRLLMASQAADNHRKTL